MTTTDTTTNTEAAEKTMHVWERAGLGAAPYRFVGATVEKFQAIPGDPNCPIQCGTSCDYCATGIMNAFWFVSHDGKKFKVGCDCFYRSKSTDARLTSQVERAERKLNAAKRAAKKAAVKEDLAGYLSDLGVRAKLATLPHPKGFSGLTALDYADWMAQRAGATGRAKVLKQIKAMIV